MSKSKNESTECFDILAGSGSRNHYFLEIRNQQGEKMKLPEVERQVRFSYDM